MHLVTMKTAVQYLTDESGEKTGVLIPIKDYKQIMEDLQDLADIVDRRDEPTVSHKEFLAKLRQDGLLPD
jgi:PHD/YefM family antitoxin component YafN of YafNO toxin-antitoxin module